VEEQLKKHYSIRDFQCNFIYQSVQSTGKSSDGLTTSGFENNPILPIYLYPIIGTFY
jgi:hypothetical protein